MDQQIKTILVPELGLSVVPEFVVESKVGTDFSRVLAHLVGQTGSRSIVIKATSDGRLMVATAGTSNEVYAVENGNAPDAYNAGSTFEFLLAQNVTDFLIETNDATISFRNLNGVWGDDKALPVGGYSIDLINYGVRIQNRVALAVCAYEITIYS